MSIQIKQVDAFTAVPFKGNPAGVCVLPKAADAAWMQNVALEMNLSETAFLVQKDTGYDLRWFTPAAEVDLCGHATLASAHVLWEDGFLAQDQPAIFHTRGGQLSAVRRGEWIAMDFPAKREEPANAPAGLVEALGITPSYIGKNLFDYIVEVESEQAVRDTQPEFSRLRNVEARGVIVTARSQSLDYDFVSRFFAPRVGINEDPVTGSAHCCLAPYWAERLGKQAMVGYQASPRGGIVRVELKGERVSLIGQAVTVLRAELVV